MLSGAAIMFSQASGMESRSGAHPFFDLLRHMGRDDLTTHGFRSTFRDWCAEQTEFPSEVAEMALAHVVSGKVEAAYRRGDPFEERRQLAQEWGSFCTAVPSHA